MNNDRITEYTTDLYNFNKHFLNVVQSQKESGKVESKRAAALLNDIDVMLTNQIKEIENFEGLIDESGFEKVKETFASITGTIAGNLDAIRNDKVSKMIRDNYAALSMLASGYTMLNTLSIARKNDALASFAADNLEKLAVMITETSRILPFVVADELVEDSDEAERIGEQSMKETQLAWKPEHLFVEE